jgi:uncharacterized protein YsxB (DUF464 family)
MNDETMMSINTTSNYGFSCVKLDALGATEYTLVTIVCDKSSSLSGYDRDLEKMVKAAVESCQKSARAENLMVRLVTFASDEEEVHGFKLLGNIDIKDYDGKIICSGCTKLIDTTYNAIEATAAYGKKMMDQDYLTNAIIYVITDGMDNVSTYKANRIKTIVDKIRKDETSLESIATVLIGMNGDATVQTYLQDIKTEGDFTEYIDMGDVTPGKLAKLAGYISRSTSSTSQALGSGGTSQSLSI